MKRATIISSLFQKLLRKPHKSAQWELYRTCNQLMLDKFISCLVDQDYSVLVISGNPPKSVLEETWSSIRDEYSELTASEESSHTAQLISEVSILQSKLFRINFCVELARQVYASSIIDELRELDMPYEFNAADPESYLADLDKCIERSKGINMKLKIKQAELEAWYAENKSKKQTTREDFDAVLAQLTENNGFFVDETKITVTQFVRMYNHLLRKAAALRAATEKIEMQ